jgi:hypothetical protein
LLVRCQSPHSNERWTRFKRIAVSILVGDQRSESVGVRRVGWVAYTRIARDATNVVAVRPQCRQQLDATDWMKLDV